MAKYKFSDKNKLIIPLASTAILSILAFVLTVTGQAPVRTQSKAAYTAPVATVKPSPTPKPKVTPKTTPTKTVAPKSY